MNKLLMAGLLSAVVVAGAQAEVTNCNPGSFYAGLNVGFVAHKAQLKVKEGTEADGTAAKLLAEMKKAKDAWEKGAADAQKVVAEKTTANAETAKTQTEKLTAAQKAYSDELIAKYKATAAGTLGIGTTAVPADTQLDALVGFTKILFNDEAVKKTFAASVGNTQLDSAITAAKIADYNKAIETVIPTYVAQLFDGKLPEATAKTLTVEKAVVGSVSDHTEFKFADATVKTNTEFTTAKTAAEKTAADLKTATTALETEKAKTKFLETVFADGKEVKLADLKDDASVKAKVAAVNKLEMSELLLNPNAKRSKTKGGFVAEAVFGFDHRIDDMMVGAELYVGLDTSKLTLRDKKVTDARKAGTADKSIKDGVELKRQFYVGIAPRIGYMFTPQLEGYFMVGAQLNRYSINAKGLAVVFDHSTAMLEQAKAANEAKAKYVAELKKTDETAATAEEKRIPTVSTEETYTARNASYKKHNKTKFAPVIGVGIRYAFTPDVFGTLQYKYQFNTKVTDYNKTGGIQIKDQNHTVTVGVGFRF